MKKRINKLRKYFPRLKTSEFREKLGMGGSKKGQSLYYRILRGEKISIKNQRIHEPILRKLEKKAGIK